LWRAQSKSAQVLADVGETQETIAERVGISRQRVGEILKECKKPPLAETYTPPAPEPEADDDDPIDPEAAAQAKRRAADAWAKQVSDARARLEQGPAGWRWR
jgi:DNA-binding transcriptional regulator LsrR (DeoR family)